MKKILFALILSLCAALPSQARQGGNLGLGFQLGDPSGISGKYWLNHDNAVDFLMGYSPYNDWIFAKADYLFHNFSLIPVHSGELPLFFGMGVMTGVGRHRPGVGIEGVVGLEYLIPSAPLDVYLSLAPGAMIIPETRANVNAGIGMRFFF